MRLTTGRAQHGTSPGEIVGRLTAENLPQPVRGECIRFFGQGAAQVGDLAGYRAVLSHDDF